MTSYEFGDIVLVAFPQSGTSQRKNWNTGRFPRSPNSMGVNCPSLLKSQRGAAMGVSERDIEYVFERLRSGVV